MILKSPVTSIKEGSIVLLDNGEWALWHLSEMTAKTYAKSGAKKSEYKFSENDKLHILRTPLQVGSQFLIDMQRAKK